MITKEDIESLFAAQLAKIEDPELRTQVVDVWVTACKRSAYTSVEALRKMPFTLLTDCRGVDFISHTVAVTEGAIGLAKAQLETYAKMAYEIDMDRLVAGGLLHDVGKVLEIEPDGSGGYRKSRNGMCARHPISGAILAGEAGCSDEIVNTIACHAKEGDGRPKVIETILIHQADFATFDPFVMLEKGQLIR
jgi:putative nucleotidyltransferase with HDIG domain